MAENIKRARAAVCPETINEYFDNLDTSLQDVKPKNVVNYDETNFVDDPGRHAEKIIDSSKTATSVMFARTASGRLLPLMIV